MQWQPGSKAYKKQFAKAVEGLDRKPGPNNTPRLNTLIAYHPLANGAFVYSPCPRFVPNSPDSLST
jgi:hypothetical protein